MLTWSKQSLIETLFPDGFKLYQFDNEDKPSKWHIEGGPYLSLSLFVSSPVLKRRVTNVTLDLREELYLGPTSSDYNKYYAFPETMADFPQWKGSAWTGWSLPTGVQSVFASVSRHNSISLQGSWAHNPSGTQILSEEKEINSRQATKQLRSLLFPTPKKLSCAKRLAQPAHKNPDNLGHSCLHSRRPRSLWIQEKWGSSYPPNYLNLTAFVQISPSLGGHPCGATRFPSPFSLWPPPQILLLWQ